MRKRAGDASNCDLSEDGDVQDHGKRETQVDGVIGDNDLLDIFDERVSEQVAGDVELSTTVCAGDVESDLLGSVSRSLYTVHDSVPARHEEGTGRWGGSSGL